MTITWTFPDLKQDCAVEIENSVLVYTEGTHLDDAHASVVMPKTSRSDIQIGDTALDDELAAGRVQVTGSKEKVGETLGLLVEFDPLFNIVTP